MHYLCVTLFPTYTMYTRITTTIIACSIFCSVYNLFVSNNICSLFFSHIFSWLSSNHDCSLHTQCVFTQDWLNYYYSLPALSYPFIVLQKQSNERSLSQELYRNYIVVCPLCTQCLLLRSHTCLSLFLSCLLLVYLKQV